MRKPATAKETAKRLETIRRQNTQRHKKAGEVQKLREEIQRHTANRNRQMELDRLLEASLRHNGLSVPAMNRMRDLQNMVSQ